MDARTEWTFDILEFNNACRDSGLSLHPAQNFRLSIQDNEHLKRSVSEKQNPIAQGVNEK